MSYNILTLKCYLNDDYRFYTTVLSGFDGWGLIADRILM
jgi:hypothetical protein